MGWQRPRKRIYHENMRKCQHLWKIDKVTSLWQHFAQIWKPLVIWNNWMYLGSKVAEFDTDSDSLKWYPLRHKERFQHCFSTSPHAEAWPEHVLRPYWGVVLNHQNGGYWFTVRIWGFQYHFRGAEGILRAYCIKFGCHAESVLKTVWIMSWKHTEVILSRYLVSLWSIPWLGYWRGCWINNETRPVKRV